MVLICMRMLRKTKTQHNGITVGCLDFREDKNEQITYGSSFQSDYLVQKQKNVKVKDGGE